MIGYGVVVAHQGGWDEVLLVAVPIVVIVALLAIAKRRVDSITDTDDTDSAGDDGPVPGDRSR